MDVEVHADAAAVARVVADELEAAIHLKPQLVLGLPTGRTPLLLYRELVARARAKRVDFSRVRTFNLDEFAGLNGEDAASFRAYMDRHFFGLIGMPPAQIEFLDGRAAELDAECARYEAAIARLGGLDVVVLGLGDNGHLAFNEPAEELREETHRTPLTRPTRIANLGLFGGDAAQVPREALTVGMRQILGARRAVLLVTGAEKAEIAARALEGSVDSRIPASLLQKHANATAHLDEAAGAQLTRVSASSAHRR